MESCLLLKWGRGNYETDTHRTENSVKTQQRDRFEDAGDVATNERMLAATEAEWGKEQVFPPGASGGSAPQPTPWLMASETDFGLQTSRIVWKYILCHQVCSNFFTAATGNKYTIHWYIRKYGKFTF